MGLRCLLGHDFGEPEVEREREEDGNEMVVTIREVKTCQRCGERQIISENKEVTAIRSAEEVGLDEDATAETEPEPTHPAVDEDDAAADEEFEPPADADEDDGVILDEEPPEREPGEWPDRDGGTTADADGDDAASGLGGDEVATEDEISRAGERPSASADAGPDLDSVEDDAEFIDAEEDPANASADADADDDGTVAWPERESPGDDDDAADAGDGTGPAAWPEHDGEDEGYEARPAGEAGGDDDHGVTFGSGITPEAANGDPETAERAGGGEAGGEGYDAEFVGGPDNEADAGDEFVRAESRSVELETEMDGTPTEYYCPNCGYTREGTGSSMRAGDICPECRKGYMAEREA